MLLSLLYEKLESIFDYAFSSVTKASKVEPVLREPSPGLIFLIISCSCDQIVTSIDHSDKKTLPLKYEFCNKTSLALGDSSSGGPPPERFEIVVNCSP